MKINRNRAITITLAVATIMFASFTLYLLAQPRVTVQYVLPPQAEYTCTYHGYTVYRLEEIDRFQPANPPLFIAVKGNSVISATDYPDLLSDIDEALR